MKLHYAFYVDCPITWQGMPSEKELYRLFYVVDGRLKLSCMMKTHKIGNNQAVILKPGDRVSIAKSESSSIKLWEIGFFADSIPFDTMTMLFGKKQSQIKRILPLIKENKEASSELLKLLLDLFGYDEKKEAYEISEAAERFVNANLDKVVSTDDVAKALGVTKSLLAKSYLSARGDSIKAYVINKKIAYAKELLEFSMLNLTEIAALLGFDDANLFTKFFTYHTKISPANYRRKVNGV